MAVNDHIKFFELIRETGPAHEHHCDAAIQLFRDSQPKNDAEEAKYCLNVAAGWGLEGERLHAQAWRLLEQRAVVRAEQASTIATLQQEISDLRTNAGAMATMYQDLKAKLTALREAAERITPHVCTTNAEDRLAKTAWLAAIEASR